MRFWWIAMAIGTSCASCIPTVIGGAMYQDGARKQARAVFQASFVQSQTELAKAGLPPLDWCIEVVKFDLAWAKTDDACRRRIHAKKKGHLTAMTPGFDGMTLPPVPILQPRHTYQNGGTS